MTHLARRIQSPSKDYSFKHLKVTPKECSFGVFQLKQHSQSERYFFQKEVTNPLLEEFSSLIDSRQNYLDGLLALGDSWANGESIGPNARAISYAKEVLRKVEFVARLKNIENIKLVLGPMPKGGIQIELFGIDGYFVGFTLNNSGGNKYETSIDHNYSEEQNLHLFDIISIMELVFNV